MVFLRWIPALDRLRRSRITYPGAGEATNPKKAEVYSDLRVPVGWLVSIVISLIPLRSSALLDKCVVHLADPTTSACIVSILRLHGLYAASKSQDLTYDNATAVTWSTVELNTGIICACFPALRPIVSSLFPRLLSTAGRTTAGQSNTFPAESRSRAYYQRHDSTIELSKTAIEPTTHSTTADGGSGDEISFDTATKEPGIHVTSEWRVERSTSTTDDGESGVLGRAV